LRACGGFFDAGDDTHCATALDARGHVDVEDALETLRPTHGSALLYHPKRRTATAGNEPVSRCKTTSRAALGRLSTTGDATHTVIPELCTGRDLCLPPCPVDCIEMRPLAPPVRAWRSIPLVLV
jgi:Na+-translocating ferredoxin:NAD+ oxidoreductase RNF subunit RnfB